MAQSKVTSLQWPMFFTATFTSEDVGDELIIDVPPGFILLDAGIVVTTAFNGTTPTVSAVDNKASPNTIIASGALAVGDLTMADVKGTYYPSGGKITFKPVVASGTPTAGVAHLFVGGVVPGRQNERYGTSVAT